MTSHDVPLSDVAQGEVFTKHVAQPDSAYAEAAGLNWLGAASPQVVKVVAVSDHTISTTKITPKRPTRAAAEAAGRTEERLELPDGATLAGLRELLAGRDLEMARVIGVSSFLVNAVSAPADSLTPLADGDRVDVLPPFAGG